MSYQVVAPLVIAKDQAGRSYHVYEGGVIPWLGDEQREQWLESGLIVEIGSAPADSEDDDDGDADEVTEERPASNANRATLVAWVVKNLSKPDGSDYTAEELGTKAELWALIDAAE